MQADEVQNTKEPIAAQIDLSGQTLNTKSDNAGRFAISDPKSKLCPLEQLPLGETACLIAAFSLLVVGGL